jgi:hypothetical protein
MSEPRGMATGLTGLYVAIWERALKDEYKYQKGRLARDTGIPGSRLQVYFPRLKKAVKMKIWREHEHWPDPIHRKDQEYEREYQEILKEATNDKKRVAGNSELAEGNSSTRATS